MSVEVRIIVPKEIAAWERGFRSLVPDLAAREIPTWQAATEVFFEATQRYVHVITGRLKASGKMTTVRSGDEIVGAVAYTAPYAIYEFRRGGAHDAMNLGWLAAQETYRRAMGEMWTRVVASWR